MGEVVVAEFCLDKSADLVLFCLDESAEWSLADSRGSTELPRRLGGLAELQLLGLARIVVLPFVAWEGLLLCF